MTANALIDKLRTEVDNNLQNEQFGVEELAESVSMSRSTLHRKLQDTTGQSVSQFIREHRLQKALNILKEEEVSIAEVAHRVGFSSSSYFSKSFTEFYGYRPVDIKTRGDQWLKEIKSDQKSWKISTKIMLLVGLFVLIATAFYYYTSGQDQELTTSQDSEIPVAVIPFKNLNPQDDTQYFADGVMEAILNKLSRVDLLRVTSRTSVEKFRNTTRAIPEIGKELGVDYILEGSAQKYGNEIKVTAQLIDVKKDDQIWSQDFTRTFEDVFSLQGEIAESVAGKLKTSLSGEEKEALRMRPTESAEAYNYLLLGNDQADNRATREGLKKAFTFYRKAIELDPNYVDAHVELANVLIVSGSVWGIRPQSVWDSVQTILTKCLELDPHNGKAYHFMAAGQYLFNWDFRSAFENFKREEEYSEHTLDDWDSDFYTKIGAFEKTLQILDRNIELNPLTSWNYSAKAQALYFLNRKPEAIKILDQANDHFDDFLLKRECVKLYFLYGETDRFLESYEKLLVDFPDRPPLVIWFGAMHSLIKGTNINPFIDQLEDRYENHSSGSPAWFIALTYAALQEDDLVFHWLEKSYDRREVEMTWLKFEPALDLYKDDSRYLDLMARMNFPS